MALTQQAVVPLRRLGVRLPEGEWLGDIAPGLGTIVIDPDGKLCAKPQWPRAELPSSCNRLNECGDGCDLSQSVD